MVFVLAFSNRLKYLRSQKKIDQKEFGKIFQLSKQTISAYEKEKATPSLDTFVKMADYFGVTADYLLDRPSYSIENGTDQTGNSTSTKDLIDLIDTHGILRVLQQLGSDFFKDEASDHKMEAIAKATLDQKKMTPVSDDLKELIAAANSLKPEQIVILRQLINSMSENTDTKEKAPADMPEP
jgi:transcriptional regulator with XRE-family HTH domain